MMNTCCISYISGGWCEGVGGPYKDKEILIVYRLIRFKLVNEKLKTSHISALAFPKKHETNI